ncbi:FAD-binding domain-containing protein [Auriscalpium vulgare]|uniref:FAD-binding domain-containing protein n=1 Tax=Auriscalpium vulgare TaxID=40419 RepID=A0ACB8RIS8_9AGAM|nr:FAD-binding domain-containing protein [Auriscalpium vulgare]
MTLKLPTLRRILLGLFGVSTLVGALPDETRRSPADYLSTCQVIATAVSNASDVYYPGLLSLNYAADNAHWAASSSDVSACSVEPGSPADVGLQIVGSTKTPFAVKGGGHASNPGFSSTKGVQISMTRFNQVTNNPAASTVDVGAGLIWDDVYKALDGTGVNIVGGRVPGVGVAGFTLGGGYSWKTNQYGLTIDNIAAYELVLPSGNVTTVTSADNDLWFALRGGGNNFGIVTKFTLKSHPQTAVWGGSVVYSDLEINPLFAAIAKFSSTVTDKKAAILPTIDTEAGGLVSIVLMFYDGPSPPSGIFDDLLAIPSEANSVKTQSFSSFLTSLPSTNPAAGPRALFSSVSVLQYTESLLKVIYNETVYWAARLALLDTSPFVSYDIEPFNPALFSYGSGSAYPPSRAQPLLPTNLYFSWTLSAIDVQVHDAILQSSNTIKAAAVAEGQNVDDASEYGNYALYDTPLQGIYGGNVARLKAIHASVDPQNVMGLAGGFKF